MKFRFIQACSELWGRSSHLFLARWGLSFSVSFGKQFMISEEFISVIRARKVSGGLSDPSGIRMVGSSCHPVYER